MLAREDSTFITVYEYAHGYVFEYTTIYDTSPDIHVYKDKPGNEIGGGVVCYPELLNLCVCVCVWGRDEVAKA